jgi:lipoprotein-anchoring transpeptidase ErfK/SrfK
MPSKVIYSVAAAVLVLALCVLAMVVYDGSRSDTVAQGVKIANVDVGGLDAERARQRVSAQLLKPLSRPLTVPVRNREFELTGRRARVRADVEAIVDDAIEQGRKGGIFARTWRGITGGERNITVKPKIEYSTAAVNGLVRRVQRALDRPAVDAKVDFAPENVSIRSARTGRRVDAKRFRASVQAELVSAIGDRTVEVPLRTIKPKVTSDKLADRYPVVVTIKRGAFQLSLYKRLKLVKTYPIAVGQVGLETPAGLYTIQNKAVNPAWTVPNAAWAGSLAGQVIPAGAANNPLKSRWLGVYDGVGVHGTSDRGSIGSNASHGCIRMLIEDVEALYDEVPVGAPIYIG